jgi:hypothetical protein
VAVIGQALLIGLDLSVHALRTVFVQDKWATLASLATLPLAILPCWYCGYLLHRDAQSVAGRND